MKKQFLVVFLMAGLLFSPAFALQGEARTKSKKNTPVEEVSSGKQVTLRQLGLLQLAAHDFFNVNRFTEIDHENGKLDLSTLLDHGDENIAIGGEPRNRENIILFSVAKEYGELYEYYTKRRYSPEEAREKLLKKYHSELSSVYSHLFGEGLPAPTPGEATMTENLAFRSIHGFLPGHISVGGETFITTDGSLVGKTLSRKELLAHSRSLDGDFAPEFRNIVITIPPGIVFQIDLFERDSSFGDQFGTDHTFEYFMAELEDGQFDPDEIVVSYIRSLFAKGLYTE